MCGIAGFGFGPTLNKQLTAADRQILACYLASAMDSRGGDSYGIAKLDGKEKIKTWRGLGRAIGNLRLDSLAFTPQMMLHTRKRTHGAISIENAHPLLDKHVLGCHNGIVSNHDELNKKYGREFDLDSRHIFAHLANNLPTKEIEVYGAISFIDLNEPHRLKLCKVSAAGDLHILGIGESNKDVLGCVYASTKDPIVGALTALHLSFFSYDIVPKQMYWINEDGSLRTNHRKLEFSSPSYYGNTGWSDTNRSRTHLAAVPDDFKPCKPCRKKIFKQGKNFRAIDLCMTCWRKCVDEHRLYDKKKDTTGTTVTKKSGCVYDQCTNPVHIRDKNICWCKEHYDWASRNDGQAGGSKKETNSLEEGPFQEMIEDVEGADGTTPSTSIERPYPRWNLCWWDMDEMSKKKKAKLTISDLCLGCREQFKKMMDSMGAVGEEAFRAYTPVSWCYKCKVVPLFMLERHKDKYRWCDKCRLSMGVSAGRPICAYCKHPIKVGETITYMAKANAAAVPYHKVLCWDAARRRENKPQGSVVLAD